MCQRKGPTEYKCQVRQSILLMFADPSQEKVFDLLWKERGVGRLWPENGTLSPIVVANMKRH